MKSKIVSTRLSLELAAKIKKYATKDKKTLSQWLKFFLEKTIK